MAAEETREVDLVKREPLVESIMAMSSATAAGSALPTPAYSMLFPILAAVLSWPQRTPLHEDALAAVALHVLPGHTLPRRATLALLYNVLETLPSFRCSLHMICRDMGWQMILLWSADMHACITSHFRDSPGKLLCAAWPACWALRNELTC